MSQRESSGRLLGGPPLTSRPLQAAAHEVPTEIQRHEKGAEEDECAAGRRDPFHDVRRASKVQARGRGAHGAGGRLRGAQCLHFKNYISSGRADTKLNIDAN